MDLGSAVALLSYMTDIPKIKISMRQAINPWIGAQERDHRIRKFQQHSFQPFYTVCSTKVQYLVSMSPKNSTKPPTRYPRVHSLTTNEAPQDSSSKAYGRHHEENRSCSDAEMCYTRNRKVTPQLSVLFFLPSSPNGRATRYFPPSVPPSPVVQREETEGKEKISSPSLRYLNA